MVSCVWPDLICRGGSEGSVEAEEKAEPGSIKGRLQSPLGLADPGWV